MHLTLIKKALRDIRGHLGAYLACAMLMAIGVLFYSAMTQVAGNLPVTMHKFYADYRFANAFASVKSMPAANVGRLTNIEGVSYASGRLVSSARVVRENDDSNVQLMLISYDPAEQSRLNDLLVVEGGDLTEGSFAMLLSQNFYAANGLSPGDTLDIAFLGRKLAFTVEGAVQMPEFVYITPENSIMPDDKNYGIAYVPLDIMESLLGRSGEVNDIAVLFETGYNYDILERPLKDTLSPNGLIQLVPREDQASNSMLEMELTGIETMVGVVPLIFLALGSLIMSVVIKRMVEQQHAQIGLMKAYGYSQRDVLTHYSIYGVVIGLLASLIGGVLGALTAGYIAQMYRQYFAMPGISGAFSLSRVFQLSMMALLFGVGASLYGARGILRLSAAQAMRPAAPPSGKPILLERVRFVWDAFSTTAQMSMRNLFRSRSRSILTWLGLMVCYALTAAVFAFQPMIDIMLVDNFLEVQNYDYKIGLERMTDARALEKSLSHMQGVGEVEAVLELPLTLRAGSNSKDASLMAIPGESSLYRLFDDKQQPLSLPPYGVVLTYRLAEELGVTVGDTILLDIPYPDCEAVSVVSMLCEQYASNYVLVDRAHISSLMRTGQMASGAMMRVKPGDENAVERMTERLNEADNVASVMDILQLQRSMADMMETSTSMLYVMAVMAVFAGFAIVYNASVVILSERIRELASLRVLGFSLRETVTVVALEQLVLLAAGVLAGIPLSGAAMESLAASVATDAYSMPTVVPLISHVTSVVCMLGAWISAMLVTARKVRNTEMSDVLKGRD